MHEYKRVRNQLGDCFNHVKEFGNPLRRLIESSKVSYRFGGIFRFKNIKASFHGTNVYMEIEIMVCNSLSDENYD